MNAHPTSNKPAMSSAAALCIGAAAIAVVLAALVIVASCMSFRMVVDGSGGSLKATGRVVLAAAEQTSSL